MNMRAWYFQLLLLCSIYLSVQGQISWDNLPISENAQGKFKNNWDNAVGGVKQADEITGQNMSENIEEIAENAGISFSESPSPSPTMTPTPSVTPSSTPSPSITPTSSPSETPAPSTTPTSTASPTPTKSASPTPFRFRRSASPPASANMESLSPSSSSPTPSKNVESVSPSSSSPTPSDNEESVSPSPSQTFADPAASSTPTAASTPTSSASPTASSNIESISPSPSGNFVEVKQTSDEVDVPADGTSTTVDFEPVLSDEEEEEKYVPPAIGDKAVISNFMIDGDFSGQLAPNGRQMFRERVLGLPAVRQSIGLTPQIKVLANGQAIVLRRTISCTGSLLPLEEPQKVEVELVNVYDDKAGVKIVFTAEGPFGSSCRVLLSFEVTTVRKLREGVPLPSLSPIAAPSKTPAVNVSPSQLPPSPTPTPSPSPSVSTFAGVPEDQNGMKCSLHPAYFDGLKGVLLRSWKSIGRINRYENSAYRPRWNELVYRPRLDPESTKYENLDLLQFGALWDFNESQILYVKFTRPAKVYLFLRAWDSRFDEITFEDWTSEGWAKLKDGSSTARINLSIQGEVWFYPSQDAYVFSKYTENDEIILPGGGYITNNAVGTEGDIISHPFPHYWLLLAEEDGSASTEPVLPAGVGSISPGLRCADSLHDLWVSPPRSEEPDVAGERFETVHPLWDPCYWCAYNHEHGSIPFEAMNWYPRLDYVSFKNNETESREGHKGYMVRTDDYLFYYGLHVHASRSRRFFTRFHTVVFVVVDSNTKEVLLELSHKGDFGPLLARPPPFGEGPVIPVNIEDAQLLDEITKSPIPVARLIRRLVNVNDPRNRDPFFGYRNSKNLLAHFYEQWITFPMCSDGNGIIEVDIQNPSTALKEKGGSSEMTNLGWAQEDNPYEVRFHNPSTTRQLKAFGFNFSSEFCNFEMPDSTGVFYTSPDGLTLKSGPGRGNVRQYIKPGFSFTLKSNYRANDTFIGMYHESFDGFDGMRDIGKAVDPLEN